MSKDVTCQIFPVFFRALDARAIPRARLVEGTRCTLVTLETKSERIAWDDFADVLTNVGRLLSDAELIELGRQTLRNPLFRYISVVVRTLFSATEFYRWLFGRGSEGFGVQAFKCVIPSFAERAPLRLELALKLPPGHKLPREFFLICLGNFIEMPRLLGLPEATVQMAPIADGASYQVNVPPGGGLWGRFWRAVMFPFTMKANALELKSAHEGLQARFDELEVARGLLAAKNEELSAANLGLEQKVKERTGQLEASLQKVTEADRLKTEFFGNASHELRTPLTLMLAPLEVIAATPGVSDEAKSEIGGVVRSGYRLLKLVNDLLDLSKLEAGKMTLQMGSADIVQVLNETVRSWKPALRGRKVTLVTDMPASLPMAGDAERLEQVALNLISNAVKFTPDGGTLTLKAGKEAQGIWFAVENSGEGIEADELPKLFGRFTQSTRSKARRFGSTGLGLPVVKELVELHGGTIDAESKLGEWVRFTVHLPEGVPVASAGAQHAAATSGEMRLYEAAAIRENSVVAAPLAVADAADQRDLPTLLVAEDNEALRSFVVKNLSPLFRIIEAGDGEQALRLAREHLPEVVLSDLMMPLMDGLQLCAALKGDPQTQHIPFVLLTARADIDTRLSGLNQGADDYLMKPFHLEELKARLRSQLRMRQLATKLAHREKLAALGSVVAGVAHEIRNPLNGIINALVPVREMLPPNSPELLELVDLAIQSSRRVETLSTQLLAQGRANEGETGDVELSKNVALALQLLAHKASNGLELTSSLEEVSVTGEAGALHQVWVNLIDNALQAAAPSGKGKVSVAITRVNGQAIVEVADNGPGIEARHLKRIFDPFFTTKDVGSGTGLGLAIVREIVEKHGGQISVDSRPGQGARFTVKLPITDGAAAHAN